LNEDTYVMFMLAFVTVLSAVWRATDVATEKTNPIAGTFAAQQPVQYYPQGYQQQQQPWQAGEQYNPASPGQQYQAQQYSVNPPQQPAWYGVSEQPAWYGAQQVAYQGQAAGYPETVAAQPQQPSAYSPEQVALPAQQHQQTQLGYSYDAAQASQQHAWHVHQAQQQHTQQHPWQAHQQPEQQQQHTEQFPPPHIPQQQHTQQNVWQVHQGQQQQQQPDQQYAHEHQYPQQYQYENYAAPQAYSPYGYSQHYQPHQPYGSNNIHQGHDADPSGVHHAQTGYQADAASEPSKHANTSSSPVPEPAGQAPAPPTVHEAAPVPVPAVVDVSTLLFQPHRASRPHSIVVLVRGIPGSGKSWLAQRLRALEIENGGKPPRILSIDPYFMVDDENLDARAPNSVTEKYVHDAAKEGAQTLLLRPMRCLWSHAPANETLFCCSCCLVCGWCRSVNVAYKTDEPGQWTFFSEHLQT
jgi:hypothetical protein